MMNLIDAYSDEYSEDLIAIEVKTEKGFCIYPIKSFIQTEVPFGDDKSGVSVGFLDLTKFNGDPEYEG